jgi:hypothetical protein
VDGTNSGFHPMVSLSISDVESLNSTTRELIG